MANQLVCGGIIALLWRVLLFRASAGPGLSVFVPAQFAVVAFGALAARGAIGVGRARSCGAGGSVARITWPTSTGLPFIALAIMTADGVDAGGILRAAYTG